MLPKTTHPIYDFTVPSSKKLLHFRPFLVKDKRNLLIALETKDDQETVKAVKQLITNCVLDEGFDIESLASFDLELFFLHLRAKSDSEIVEGNFICTNTLPDGKECGAAVEVKENILNIKLTEVPGHTNKIMLGATNGIMMKYPNFSLLEKAKAAQTSATSVTFDFIVSCVESIFDAENIWRASEVGPKEVADYLDNLETPKFRKIEEFFTTMPSLKKTITRKCHKCSYEHEIDLEGLQSFFDF